MDSIVPNRTQISDRFPIASFSIGVPEERYFEVACATDPSLFHTANQDRRSPQNFFTSRSRGLMRASRNGTTYMVPPSQLQQFAGARRLYYALATYGGSRGESARFSIHPDALERAPSIAVSSDFTGRSLDRSRIGRPAPDLLYGGEKHRLRWGGDDALVIDANVHAATAPESQRYDDGFGEILWEEDQGGECRDDEDEGQGGADAYASSLEDEMAVDRHDEPKDSEGGFEDPSDLDAGPEAEPPPEPAEPADLEALSIPPWEKEEFADREAPEPYEREQLDLHWQRSRYTEDADGFEEHNEAYGGRRRGPPRRDGRAHEESLAADPCDCALPGGPSYGTHELGVQSKLESIVETAAEAESGDRRDLRKYSATTPTASGLSWGLVKFDQRSGSLGKVLARFRDRSFPEFMRTFGPLGDELLQVATATEPEERMRPVGGEALSGPTWTGRFEEAGRSNACRAAQREVAVTEYLDPNLRFAAQLGLTTDRALAMLYDRCIDMGNAAGVAWVARNAGPIQNQGQLSAALSALRFPDLASFQSSVRGLTANGRWNAETHAALAHALRQLGSASPIPLESEAEMLDRLVHASHGTGFQRRLERLRTTKTGVRDVAYRLAAS